MQRKRASMVPVIMIGAHLFAWCLGTESVFIKICKANQQHICSLLYDFRVIQADAKEEGDTYININRFLADWTKGNTNLRAMKLDMQFLDHHSKQFLDLEAELIKMDYSQQQEAASTNLNTLLLL